MPVRRVEKILRSHLFYMSTLDIFLAFLRESDRPIRVFVHRSSMVSLAMWGKTRRR